MYFGPGYHAFVAAVAYMDDELLATLKCVRDVKAVCNLGGLTTLFLVQGIVAAISAFFLFLATRRLTGDIRVAWLALLVALGSKIFSEYASQILTEVLAFFFFFAFNWALAVFLTEPEKRRQSLLLSGAAIGAAALVRPSYLYLIYFMAPALGIWTVIGQRENLAAGLRTTALFGLGAAAVVMPWVLRNYFEFGVAAVTAGQGAKVLVERLPYNLMTGSEWAKSFIYWLPDFGDSLAAWLWPKDSYIRLSFEHPDSFYMMGRGPFFTETWTAAGASKNALGYLLENHVLNDFGKHVSVTFALAWRGMWAGRYVGFVGFLLLPACFYLLHRQERLGPFVVYCLPGFFMLGLYAFVSVNVVRYNDPLIAVFAPSSAVVIVYLGSLIARRIRKSE